MELVIFCDLYFLEDLIFLHLILYFLNVVFTVNNQSEFRLLLQFIKVFDVNNHEYDVILWFMEVIGVNYQYYLHILLLIM